MKCVFCGDTKFETVCDNCVNKIIVSVEHFRDLIHGAAEIYESKSQGEIVEATRFLVESFVNLKKKISPTISPTMDFPEFDDLPLSVALKQFKRWYIKKMLNKYNGSREDTYKRLKIQRTYLSRLITELEIREE